MLQSVPKVLSFRGQDGELGGRASRQRGGKNQDNVRCMLSKL